MKTQKEIKLAFNQFINEHSKKTSKTVSQNVLKPYMKSIQKALQNKISKKAIFAFLKEQEINITLRDFNRLLKEYELKQLNKTCKVKE